MIILVTADNFVVMFVGWEGVGLCSYLLISFWNTRVEATKSAIKALVVNRIGDVCLLLAIVLCFFVFRTVDFDGIAPQVPYIVGKTFPIFNDIKIVSLINLLLLVGIFGKSAQIGLHLWLPDSMEGPTPVSALIHAATMVTAGIYLCLRLSFIFEFSSMTLNLLAFSGTITSFISGLMGLLQSDIKKIISYSTLGQLGYMLVLCGSSQYDLALFHLINHAMFKALLFLTGGVFIYLYKTQDMRAMSGGKLLSGFLYSMVLIGSLASDGFIFFSSVESKDIVLEFGSYGLIIGAETCNWFGLMSLAMTIMFNSSLLDICDGEIFGKIPVYKTDIRFIITLTILAFFTLISNFVLFQTFMTEFYSDSSFVNLVNSYKAGIDVLPYFAKFLFVMLFGVLNLQGGKEPIRSELAFRSIVLIGWFGYFYTAFAVYMHIAGSLIGSKIFMVLTGKMIVQIFEYFPIFILLVFLFFFTKYLRNWVDFYNIKIGIEYFINKLHYDWIINLKISEKLIKFGYFLYKVVDKGILEVLGPNGISTVAWNMIKDYKKYSSGYTYNYICLFLLGLLYIFGIIFYFF
jgi:NADH:ubiquinone oxidoreductase subunit 5 (subunit L)/multisubunit Na+/H+ antiporter MnhA subunit